MHRPSFVAPVVVGAYSRKYSVCAEVEATIKGSILPTNKANVMFIKNEHEHDEI